MSAIIEPKLTCCFTGHRPEKLPWRDNERDAACLELRRRLRDTVLAAYEEGMRHFICGMAQGCDMYFAEAVMELRESRPDITLEAAIPYEGQAANWRAPEKARYRRILEACDYHTVVQRDYSYDCMARRNRYMVDASSLLIAVYNGSTGGTRSTMLYAIRRGLHIIELPVEIKKDQRAGSAYP